MRFSFLILVALLSSMAISVRAEDYSIRLLTPSKVGDIYSVDKTAEVSNDTTVSMGDHVVQKKNVSFTAKCAATMKVLKIDDLKRPIEMDLKIDSLTRKLAGGEEQALLPKGSTVILSKRFGRGVFLIDGKPASKEVAGTLALFFSVPRTNITDDDVFGTKERKKVGDTWPVNSKKALENLQRQAQKLENLKGTVKLEKAFDIKGVKCLLISAEMSSDKCALPLPPTLKVKKSLIRISVKGDTPADSDASIDGVPLKGEMNMTFSVVAEGKANPQTPFMRLSVESKRVVAGTTTKLK